MVSHTLYTAREMESVRAQYASGSVAAASDDSGGEDLAGAPSAGASPMHPLPPFQEVGSASAAQLQQEVDDLRSQVAQLRADLDELATALRRTEDDLQRLRGELGA